MNLQVEIKKEQGRKKRNEWMNKWPKKKQRRRGKEEQGGGKKENEERAADWMQKK